MLNESLTPVEIEGRLVELPRWRVDDRGKLTRQFQFVDFVAAFGFLAQAAVHAERLNHHPEWFNVYGRVDVALTTQPVNGKLVLQTPKDKPEDQT